MTPVIAGIILLLILGIAAMWFFGRSKQTAAGQGASAVASPRDGGFDLDGKTGSVLDASRDHCAAHAHYLATACDLAYYDQADGAPKFREQLNIDAHLVGVDNTQAYVCENAESIVVAFRGSESPTSIDGFKDWLLTNARNFLVLPEGRIGTDFAAAGVGARFHRGFMEALAEIWDPLHSAIEDAIRRKERPVWITGHSLGGAIALLAAWRLHQKFIEVHQIVTFGAPMIGNAAAADAYAREFPGKIHRYVDHSDMVPRLPTMSLLSNEYGHVQREVVLGLDKDSAAQMLAAAAAATVDGSISDDVADGLWNNLHNGISSHLMGNYISQIAEDLT